MDDQRHDRPSLSRNLQRNMLAGMLALIPLWVTLFALAFLFTLLANAGRPFVRGLARAVQEVAPGAAEVLRHPWFEPLLALVVIAVAVYLLGWATTHVIGRRLIHWFEDMLDHIPLVKLIYGSTKKVIAAFQARPEGVQRVVLIDFPQPGMKAVGLVTATIRDSDSGRELAMVYVPTTPNPTSGYMEIVPVERLTSTDWTLEEAMQFIITGGTSSPARIVYGHDNTAQPVEPPVRSR